MNKKIPITILVGIFVIGLSFLLYPSVSNYINEKSQSRAIAQYTKTTDKLDSSERRRILASAEKYNDEMEFSLPRDFTETELKDYMMQLDSGEDSIMGILNIPKINCRLPIYHTTNPSVLEKGVGHIEGTSLPVGGEGTHSVLSAHRGLTSAKLFTDLDELELGDKFVITVFNRRLTYEVESTSIILPYELSELDVEAEKDLCSLVTCTPYGVNSHRLVVTGHRIRNDNLDESLNIDANANVIGKKAIILIVGMFILIIICVLVAMKLLKNRK